MIAGGGLLPSGGWNNSNWRLKIVLTNKNKIAAKAKPIKGENNNALPTLITVHIYTTSRYASRCTQ